MDVVKSSTLKKKKPRILMFVPQFPMPVVGGLEKQAFLLVKNLIKQGLEVQVLSGKIKNSNSSLKIDKKLKVSRIYWPENLLLRFIFSSFSLIKYFFKNKHSFDLIHLHQLSLNSFLLIILGKLFDKKIIVKLVAVGKYGIPGVKKSFLGIFKIFLLKKVDCIISMSKTSSEELYNIKFPGEKIFYVSNGVYLPKIEKSFSSSKNLKIINLGRLSSEKNYYDLLRVWENVISHSKIPIELNIYGNGPMLNELKNFVKKKKLSCVYFHGHTNNIKDKLKKSSIFISTSGSEGNSNSILEAMSFKLPIISTNIGGTLMLVGPEGEQFISEIGDTKSISQKLLLLIYNSSLRLKVSEEMYKRATKYFEIEKVANQYVNVYSEVIKENSIEYINFCNKELISYLHHKSKNLY